MALENYVEMRDRVADADFLLRKQVERELAAREPLRFVPRYAMVSFRRTPYAVARARGELQWQLLDELCGAATRLDQVDLDRDERQLVRERLTPLDEQA